MMTQIKYMLAFLLSALYTSCLWVLVGNWKVVSANIYATIALSSAVTLMTLFITAFILRFFIVFWRKR